METCEMKDRCDFYKNLLPYMPYMSHILKGYFCKKNKTECTRFKRYKMIGDIECEDGLLPNHEDYLADRLCLGEFF